MSTPNLEHVRHSLAHLLAAAITELYPKTLNTIGPSIDNGFYYDFDFSLADITLSEKDFPAIEKKMREILKTWKGFVQKEVSVEEAKAYFADNEYKLELIDEIAAKGEKITLYTSGLFTDLCRGGHVEDTSHIASDSFKLSRVAGAYWRGDEKNKMLTRVYGLAFNTKDELVAYELMQEEAEKRDHRKLGKELDLFIFSDVVGKGLPLWTEKGATVRRELERFIIDEEIRRGYKHVFTPDIAKIDLYKKSGHYPYYKDSMYAPIKIDDEEFMLRPMTCPHHFELYLSRPRSYKELPMRIAEMAKLYRYEQSGELSGLVRVRSFCLADAHIICKDSEQAGQEVDRALDLIEYIAQIFKLQMGTDYSYRLSLGDRNNAEKYFKDDTAWDTAEEELRKVLKKRGATFIEAAAEAAFYGPKIDIQMKDVRGKENTAFTVQYDFVMPKRFELTYTDSDGTKKEPLVVHRSSIGAIERIMAFLIEKYAGAFPLWLAPIQVKIVPIGERQEVYAREILEKVRAANIRVELDESGDSLGKKIRNAKLEKIPYTLVIGDKELEAKTVTVESRDKGNIGAHLVDDFIKQTTIDIVSKS
ncbi:MAG: threonine--tRNA ligase [Patescibacteria group bacterium]